jgi:hypothetical protein
MVTRVRALGMALGLLGCIPVGSVHVYDAGQDQGRDTRADARADHPRDAAQEALQEAGGPDAGDVGAELLDVQGEAVVPDTWTDTGGVDSGVDVHADAGMEDVPGVDVAVDACGLGSTVCGCLPLTDDEFNCGVCGHRCPINIRGGCRMGSCECDSFSGCAPVPHATIACGPALCAITTCEAGWYNCDGMDGNGCESGSRCD